MFTKVSFIGPLPELAGLLMPAIIALFQVVVVPAIVKVGVYTKGELPQMSVGVNVLVRVGAGTTVTVKFWVCEHPFALRVKI